MECAAEGDGIRVNTVHPGVINTPIWTKLPVSAGSNAPIDPNEVAKTGVPVALGALLCPSPKRDCTLQASTDRKRC